MIGLTKNVMRGVALACLLATVACGGKKDEDDGESTGDICRADCQRGADECPADSFAAESVDLCKFLCGVFIDSADCRQKFQDYSDCLATTEIACEITDSPADECADLSDPFVIDLTDSGNSGECVDQDAIE